MTTLLDTQRLVTGNLGTPDEGATDQTVLRIAVVAPMIARLAPTSSKIGDHRSSSSPILCRSRFTARPYPRVAAILNLTCRAPRAPSQPLPSRGASSGRFASECRTVELTTARV